MKKWEIIVMTGGLVILLGGIIGTILAVNEKHKKEHRLVRRPYTM